MRVAFFTGGTAGAGHLVRGLAIRRALRRAGFRGSYRMFGPRQPFAAGRDDDWQVVDVPEDLLRSPDRAKETELAERLRSFAPDVLVVDMFWAPLRHVLPIPGCEAWLLLRSFPRAWLVGPPGLPFDASQYARIVAIEPVTADAVTHTIDPVVIANPDECRPAGALRRKLGAPSGRKLVAVMHAGLRGEHRSFTPALMPGEMLVTFDLHDESATFPIAEWLGDCDRIHCAAGYNSFWEAHWLRYAERTTFFPFARRNDDQRWRVSRCAGHRMSSNGADTLASWIV